MLSATGPIPKACNRHSACRLPPAFNVAHCSVRFLCSAEAMPFELFENIQTNQVGRVGLLWPVEWFMSAFDLPVMPCFESPKDASRPTRRGGSSVWRLLLGFLASA